MILGAKASRNLSGIQTYISREFGEKRGKAYLAAITAHLLALRDYPARFPYLN
jgi:plasmid stabilization system protein ParE